MIPCSVTRHRGQPPSAYPLHFSLSPSQRRRPTQVTAGAPCPALPLTGTLMTRFSSLTKPRPLSSLPSDASFPPPSRLLLPSQPWSSHLMHIPMCQALLEVPSCDRRQSLHDAPRASRHLCPHMTVKSHMCPHMTVRSHVYGALLFGMSVTVSVTVCPSESSPPPQGEF